MVRGSAGRFGGTRPALVRVGTSLALVAAVLALGACVMIRAQPPAIPTVPASQGPVLRVTWASIQPGNIDPEDPVVQLLVIIENNGAAPTESTTILWEPAFAQVFTFLRSEPAAWRQRTDEHGWGVLDTAGALNGQYGTYQLWFRAQTFRLIEPKVRVVANGKIAIAETVASAPFRIAQEIPAGQRIFEGGPAARLADMALFVPADDRGAMRIAAVLAVLLVGSTLIGLVAGLRLANGTPGPSPGSPATRRAAPPG